MKGTILKKGGKLVIEGLPDFDALTDAYLNKKVGYFNKVDLDRAYALTHGDPKAHNSLQQMHKDIFTKDSIRKLLESNGFRIENLSNVKDTDNASFQKILAICINVIAIKP